MNNLPVIDSCDDCGACCREQESPPGYVMMLNAPELMDDLEFQEDADRLRNLPAEATKELRDYLQRLLSGQTADDPVCIWYDQATHGCRYYDHRPSTCRDFERSSEDCRNWRQAYDID